MQDLLIVKDPLDSKLTVGAPSENYIAFAITAEKAVTKLQVQITIPCGEATAGEKFLCANGNEARLTPSSQPGDKLTFLCTRKEKSISWKTQQFKLDAGENIVIRIGGFNPELPGDASLQLKLVGPGLADNKSYKVSVAPALGVSILYFEATPANVLKQNTVNITVKTAGAKTIKLYANDAPVKELEPAKTTETVTAVRYIHKPQVNTTYHLKAWQSVPGDDDEADVRNGKLVEHKLTVLVRARPEWYSWDLLANSLDPADAGRDFYPTLLLTGEDLSGETKGEKLYGIFVHKGTKQAELWSSATGEDNWSYLG